MSLGKSDDVESLEGSEEASTKECMQVVIEQDTNVLTI